MSTLHIVNRSPLGSQALYRCLSLCSPGDCILLIGDGVYAAHLAARNAASSFLDQQSDVHWYALESDLAARGLMHIDSRVERVNYNGFVELVCRCHNSVSWS